MLELWLLMYGSLLFLFSLPLLAALHSSTRKRYKHSKRR
jgi:hypothetical protein